MGQLFSSLWGSLFGGARELKIVMVGLDNAGKTTVLYRMSLGQTIETTATVGSNVEQIRHGNLTFEVRLAPLTCTACRLLARFAGVNELPLWSPVPALLLSRSQKQMLASGLIL